MCPWKAFGAKALASEQKQSRSGGYALFIIDDFINGIAQSAAAKKQKKEIENAMALQGSQYTKDQGYWNPYYNTGTASLADMARMTKGNYDTSGILNDPGYQFRMSEGQKALERSAAARGGLNSGAFMKGLDRYSQGIASDEFQNRFNRLGSMVGIGQNAAGNLSNLGQNYANNMSSLYGAMGNAEAAKILANLGAGANAGKSAISMGMMSGGGGGGGYGGYGASAGAAGVGGGQGGGAWDNSGNYGLMPTQYGGGYGGGYRNNYNLGNYNIAPQQGAYGAAPQGGGYGYNGYIPPQEGGGY